MNNRSHRSSNSVTFSNKHLFYFIYLLLLCVKNVILATSINPNRSSYFSHPKHTHIYGASSIHNSQTCNIAAFHTSIHSNANSNKNEKIASKNLFSIPNPMGLSQESIINMARKRFGTYTDGSDSNISKNGNNGLPLPMIGKVAVITGAAGGIGKELCRLVYSLGGTVVALDRNSQGLEELKMSLLNTDNCGSAQKIDDWNGGKNKDQTLQQRERGFIYTLVTHHEDLASVAASADEIKSNFEKIDLLINNAGLTYDPSTSIPGEANMKSSHGKDLAFTVNYLSHFLLTEKLLPNLSSSSTSPRGRIVHVTSTYHWKVDGSEIVPQQDGTVLAYESDPKRQSLKHVERSYGNTKLAQIWHSRTIQRLGNKNMSSSSGFSSVCACPTWAATGIAGEESRDFLEQMAFPVLNCGPGITSIINAMFRTDEELENGGALDDGRCFVGNSRTIEYLKKAGANIWMTSKLVTQLGWRDTIVDLCGLLLLLGQRFTHDDFIMQETSPESYNDIYRRESLYYWSYKEVEQWI